MVPVADDIDPGHCRHRLVDAIVELLGSRLELEHRAWWTPGGQVAPVLERVEQRTGCLGRTSVPGAGRRGIDAQGRRGGCHWGRCPFLAAAGKREAGQPFSGEPKREVPGDFPLGGLQAYADYSPVARTQSGGDPNLEPEAVAVESEVAHRGLRQSMKGLSSGANLGLAYTEMYTEPRKKPLGGGSCAATSRAYIWSGV